MQTTPEHTAGDEPRQFKQGEIDDVVVHQIEKFQDGRGWLAELFRRDGIEAEYFPAMSYISSTEPGVQRGPHEHAHQADLFAFIGPSNFRVRLWDNRPDSKTYNFVMTFEAGADTPTSVLVPKGVVHAYLNIGQDVGIVINSPNRLYRGEGKLKAVDEIRHELDPETVYRMED